MKRHTELKWGDIAKQAFERKLTEIELPDSLSAKSKLDEVDIERIAREIKSKINKRLSR